MSNTTDTIKKFHEKLGSLQKETGYSYSIKDNKSFDKHIEDNTLFAGWFKPGTILATASTGSGNVTFKAAGTLKANLIDKDGQIVHAFEDTYDHFEDSAIKIEDDKDIEALENGTHPSGYTIAYEEKSKVEISISDEDVGPILADDASVARCILKKEFVAELAKASEYASAEREAALEDAMTQLSFEEVPDPPAPPEPEEAISMVPDDIPEWSETEEGKAFAKAEAEAEAVEFEESDEAEEVEPKPAHEETKPAKKNTKKAKTSSKAKKAAKTEEEPVGRFDLLPLDIIGKILSGDYSDANQKDFLSVIEEYKKSKDEEALIKAAVALSENYGSPTDLVMNLAVLVEAEAEEQGEDAWKEKDPIRCLNEAIKGYLLHLSGNEEEDILLRAAWSLICAASISSNH